MRLDKFLKNSRLIKRRTVAKEACEQGRVFVVKSAEQNAASRPAKPGTEVAIGDIIHIEFGTGSVTVRVLSTPDTVRKEDAEEMYEVVE